MLHRVLRTALEVDFAINTLLLITSVMRHLTESLLQMSRGGRFINAERVSSHGLLCHHCNPEIAPVPQAVGNISTRGPNCDFNYRREGPHYDCVCVFV